MLSKNKIKIIQSLGRKKTRDSEHVFLAEGNKLVLEAIASGLKLQLVAATQSFLEENNVQLKHADEVIACSPEEIKKASLLKNPQEALAVVEIPQKGLKITQLANDFTLVLDGIQDPGNMGTIIRTADWFGIKSILCSPNSVDCYNPKVIQSSMGAIFRVAVNYLDLPVFLVEAAKQNLPVYGTFLEGENIYTSNLSPTGLLVMGNEGNGISEEVARFVTQKIHIPTFATNQSGSESLNVATASAICCSEFRRRLV